MKHFQYMPKYFCIKQVNVITNDIVLSVDEYQSALPIVLDSDWIYFSSVTGFLLPN